MTLTHILVDFENVQPSAADIALVRDERLRLTIFRGPGQMKYAADVAEAWQPLGAKVSFIRCARAGRNAVDMHIAFILGELVAMQAPGPAARFVIVSRDTDFDPLLTYIRGLGFDATRVASLKAALSGISDAVEATPSKARAPRAVSAAKATTKKAASRKAPAKKASVASAPRKAAARSTPVAAADAEDLARVVESLQRMGEKRPTKRKGLARHIESHLGRNLAPGRLDALLAELERSGALAFHDNRVEYRLARAKK
jgi:hypothetical protein